MTTWNDVKDDPRAVKCLDHGFVVLNDIMGDDSAIADAARCSYGKGTKSVNDDRNLIRYLIRHQHTSPIEMVELKFHMKMPIFVMRQHVRHRTASLNEYSGRYSEMTDEMYQPDPSRMKEQSQLNKQGSGSALPLPVAMECGNLLDSSFRTSYNGYKECLEMGLTRELARIQLPVANYTELYWKIDLKNFFHYVKLREDSHAQEEIRVFADAMYSLVKPLLPLTCEAYEDYWSWRNTSTFSRMEMDLLRTLVSKQKWDQLVVGHRSEENLCKKFGMGIREFNEFKEKFKL